MTEARYSFDGENWSDWEAYSASRVVTLPGADGPKTVYAQFRDDSGELSPVASVDVLLDRTAPSTGDDADAVWHRTDVMLTLFPSDAGSGVAGTHYAVDGGPTQDGTSVLVPAPVDHANDGAHTVEYWSVDAVGNVESPAKSCQVRIDTTAPATTDDATAGWLTHATTVGLTPSDVDSGVTSTSYSLDNGTWTPGKAVTVSSEGVHTLRYRSTDNAGNQEAIHTCQVKIDWTAPVTTASPLDSDWHPAPWVISLDASDAGGIDYVEYRVDGGAWTRGSYPTLVTDGAHAIDYRAVDLAGNVESTNAMTARVDMLPPVTTVTGADELWHNHPVDLTLTGIDAGIGVKSTEYKLDQGDWATGTALTVSGEGSHTVQVRSTDLFDQAETPTSRTIKIDLTPPSGSFSLAGGAATTVTPSVSGASSVSDAHGPLQMRFSIDGKSTWSSWEPYAASKALTLPDGLGIKTVYGQYRDAAGNLLELSDAIELIAPPDVTLPTIGMSGVTHGAWHRAAVHVTLSASDSGSGVASITYTLDDVEITVLGGVALVDVPVSPNRLHTLRYYATDAATNSCSEKVLSFTIDTSGPITYASATSGRKGHAIVLRYKFTDKLSPRATAIKIVVKNSRNVTIKTFLPAQQVDDHLVQREVDAQSEGHLPLLRLRQRFRRQRTAHQGQREDCCEVARWRRDAWLSRSARNRDQPPLPVTVPSPSRLLALADLEHLGAAHGAYALCGRLAVLHGDGLLVLHDPLGPTFHAIRLGRHESSFAVSSVDPRAGRRIPSSILGV